MSTGRDLVKQALKHIGALAVGETPSADDQSDAITTLNRMIDSWANEGLILFSVVQESFALTPSKASYTVGPTGDFVTSRPQKILRASVTASNMEIPIDIINLDEWADIQIKSLASTIPTKMYVQGTLPNETVTLWPVPSQVNTLTLYSEKALSSIAANTTLSLPLGYEEAIVYNLALRLAPEYTKQLSEVTVGLADKALKNIKRLNTKPTYLSCDQGTLSRSPSFDWRTGK